MRLFALIAQGEAEFNDFCYLIICREVNVSMCAVSKIPSFENRVISEVT